jgi:hypothetical protein
MKGFLSLKGKWQMEFLGRRLCEPSTWAGGGMVAYFTVDFVAACGANDNAAALKLLLPVLGGLLAMFMPERKSI